MRTTLAHHWKYRTNLPAAPALLPADQPAYLMKLFEEAFAEGYKAAQADMREALGFDDGMKASGLLPDA